MKKATKYLLFGLLALGALLVIANSASAAIDLGSQKGAKNGDGTTADTIFITGQKATIPDVYADADVTTAHLAEIASGAANSTYLLNCSIQVNESGILVIDATCDWLWLASIDGKIANITCYGRLFINGSMVTAMTYAVGGLNNSVNDTTYATGAKTRPSIRVNNSEGTGDSAFGMSSARIAYLGGALNESYGGVCINDTGGSPVFTASNTHISHCYNGLFIKSIMSGTALSGLNVTNNLVYGIRLDADSAINFTNCNSSNNGAGDWVCHSDVVSNINNTDQHFMLRATASTGTADLNNITQKYRLVSRTRGNTAWNLTSMDMQGFTSDHDYCNINLTSNSQWTGETLDADFVSFTVAGLSPHTDYQLIVDSAQATTTTSDANGHATFNYTGSWSTKTFVVQLYSPSGGGGSGDTSFVTCYRCQGENVVSAEFRGECPDDWSEIKPNCAAVVTPQQPASSQGEGTLIEGVQDEYLLLAALVIVGIVIIWKYGIVKKARRIKPKPSLKWILGIIIALALLYLALMWLGVI